MPHQPSGVRVFFVIFVALLVLLALTVEAARHDLGRWNFPVSALIAAIKALLIALYFMHVRQSTPLTRLVVAAGVLWLAILFSLSLADYWTRAWLTLGTLP
jgi:cytochrome c oxidase subunit IV